MGGVIFGFDGEREGCVGIEINATRVETKFKLSQNRTKTEQENVIQSLPSSSDSAAAAIATLMKEALTSSLTSKLGALLAMPAFADVTSRGIV